jgi:hypothetical protein
MKGKKEEDILQYCFKYYICKLCPRNAKCEEEIKKEQGKSAQKKSR